MRTAIIATLVAAGAMGCVRSASPPPVSANAPGFVMDESASQLDDVFIEITKSGVIPVGSPPDQTRLREVRAVMTSALNSAVASHPTKPPARFRAKVSLTKDQWPGYACLLGILTIVGCPVNVNKATVTLTAEIGSKIYKGEGHATKFAGYYYTSEDAALAEATVAALNDAFK